MSERQMIVDDNDVALLRLALNAYTEQQLARMRRHEITANEYLHKVALVERTEAKMTRARRLT